MISLDQSCFICLVLLNLFARSDSLIFAVQGLWSDAKEEYVLQGQSINSTFRPFPVDKNLISMGLCSSRIGKCPELNFRFTIVGSQIYQGTFCDKI